LGLASSAGSSDMSPQRASSCGKPIFSLVGEGCFSMLRHSRFQQKPAQCLVCCPRTLDKCLAAPHDSSVVPLRETDWYTRCCGGKVVNINGFDPIITRLQQRIDTIRQVKQMVADDPSLASELIQALGGTNGQEDANPSRSAVLDRIIRFYRGNSNQWATMADILHGTDLPKPGVATVLYKTHGNLFQKRPVPGQKKTKQWRLQEREGSHA